KVLTPSYLCGTTSRACPAGFFMLRPLEARKSHSPGAFGAGRAAPSRVRNRKGFPMFAGLARKFFGSANERQIKGYRPRVEAINALEGETKTLSDEALRARTAEFRKQLADGKTLDDILVPAFATVREAAKRVIG